MRRQRYCLARGQARAGRAWGVAADLLEVAMEKTKKAILKIGLLVSLSVCLSLL